MNTSETSERKQYPCEWCDAESYEKEYKDEYYCCSAELELSSALLGALFKLESAPLTALAEYCEEYGLMEVEALLEEILLARQKQVTRDNQ